MFLFYIRVKVLFLPCKKASPRIVNRNTKMRNSRYLRDVPFEVKEQPMKLKSSKKRSKNVTKNSQKLKSSAQVNFISLKGSKTCHDKLWEMYKK